MGRKRGSRFRKASDAQEQLQDLEQAQRESRKKRTGKLIARTDKSAQRFDNALRQRIRRPADTEEECS